MPRLINADELIEVAHRARLDSRERIERMIELAPTVDAEPVRYGRWEYDSTEYAMGIPHYECSICGETVTEKTNYCPNCGAKMD